MALNLRGLSVGWLSGDLTDFTNFEKFSKLRTAVYPSNKARIGVKLWQNAFRTICNFSFFDAGKSFLTKFLQNFLGSIFFFKKVRFWRGYEFLIRVGRCVVKSHCPNCPYFWGDFLGEGVNDSICVETRPGTENNFNHSVS